MFPPVAPDEPPVDVPEEPPVPLSLPGFVQPAVAINSARIAAFKNES